MTLKEKFLPFVDDIDLINDIPNKEWGLRNAGKCIEIAEDFAIGFAEWFWTNKDKFYKGERDYYLEFKELLEIYKIEKGL